MIGTTLAHYRILERLGSGGMGEVWLAEDLRLGRPVALKVLEAKRREDEDERRRLLGEARMASKLNHPGIAVVYEAGEVESDAGPIGFLALEYVPGEPIDAWVARERPDLDRRLAVASEIAAALAHAHGLGIVHRDVKPSNVLVTRGGRIKILDFGLAVRHDAAAEARTSTLTDAPSSDPRIGGTLGYMAPEQAMGYDVDARADAFAFGVVLFEMLAGEKPFRGATSWELVAAVLHREAPPLVLPDGDPRGPALARIVERLLAKEPAARWGDLVAVGAELDRLRTRGATAPESPPAGTAESGLAVAAFENLTGEAEDAWIGAGLRETVASDLERLSGIALAARERVEEASRRLRGTEPAAGESFDVRLARAVGARFVVGGAVQRMDDAVRVTTRFFDARVGLTETFRFDGSLAELFALQDRVVGELARRLSLAAAANAGAAKKPSAEAAEAADETSVVEAFEALSRGLLNLRTETAEGVQRAVLFFERAVALDPRYARAHLELGVALGLQGDYLAMDTLRERALASLSVARRLRPGWTRAEREFGSLLVSLQRDEEAIAILERALGAAPSDGTLSASLARAFFLGRADFAGAASRFERALAALPHAGWYWLQLAHCRALLGELDAASTAAERAIEFQEKSLSGREGTQIGGAYMRLGHVRARQGRPAEAIEAFQRELSFVASADHALRNRIAIELHLRLGLADAALGRPVEAASHFDAGLAAWRRRLALGADDPFTGYYGAAILAQLGDDERAMTALERAAAERPRFVVERARREPELAPLAAHPRMIALVERFAGS